MENTKAIERATTPPERRTPQAVPIPWLRAFTGPLTMVPPCSRVVTPSIMHLESPSIWWDFSPPIDVLGTYTIR
jgi:hypothetical protein